MSQPVFMTMMCVYNMMFDCCCCVGLLVVDHDVIAVSSELFGRWHHVQLLLFVVVCSISMKAQEQSHGR